MMRSYGETCVGLPKRPPKFKRRRVCVIRAPGRSAAAVVAVLPKHTTENAIEYFMAGLSDVSFYGVFAGIGTVEDVCSCGLGA